MRRVRDLLARYHLRADKAFGQNYLVDAAALQSIVAAAAISAADTVLEIGPGLGVLSFELAHKAKEVVSVELDSRLLPVLAETLGGLSNVRVIHQDGLTFDFERLPEGSLLVANLPYNVGTAILVRGLESCRFKRLVFLVQKEVAERLCAGPSTPAYGALSLIVAHFGTAKRLRDVKPSAFFPAPEVTSSVVRIDTHNAAAPDPQLFKLIHQAFAHRRKTLKKNLLMAGYSREGVEAALRQLGVDSRIRAEALAYTQFTELASALFRP